ncbi:aldo/keto reductase [Roseomonas populi]|uniref:Aldo/keto reductase n=1 Tax=Roseomonas populi TaxID=3121582 RepID=A0ABT1X1L7_9PROT|nr:aldo/keto reductase [Roseomonas pecuniae]MCR0981989.1 aldo/keto reductase [Roseomonas pecuniae]
MTARRSLLSAATIGALLAPHVLASQTTSGSTPSGSTTSSGLPMNGPRQGDRWRPPHRLGLGGQPLSNGFGKVVSDETAIEVMNAAWDSGIRLYDTSPWYTLGRGERRMGQVLSSKPRDEFVLSTKVGRLLNPDRELGLRRVANWADAPPFRHVFDYTADGTRRSIEDSLQRMGLSRIDIVFVHDLSPSTSDIPDKDWRAQFEIARRGAFPALAKMKEEGIIKAWGMGVNDPEPIMAALEVAEPDIFLAATQYSLADHSKALDGIIPAIQAKGASIMVGAPLNGGFLAGKNRFNYGPSIPAAMTEKRERMEHVARNHGVDLRVAALHFLNASPVVSCFIPGASTPEQPRQNAQAFRTTIPAGFWAEMKKEGLIDGRAPTPA